MGIYRLKSRRVHAVPVPTGAVQSSSPTPPRPAPVSAVQKAPIIRKVSILHCPQCSQDLVVNSSSGIQKSGSSWFCKNCKILVNVMPAAEAASSTNKTDVGSVIVRNKGQEASTKSGVKQKKQPDKESPKKRENPVDVVARAMQDTKLISFSYVDKQGVVSTRTVEPYKLAVVKGKVAVYGFCTEKNAIRLFSMEQMTSVTVTKDVFDPRWPVENLLETDKSSLKTDTTSQKATGTNQE